MGSDARSEIVFGMRKAERYDLVKDFEEVEGRNHGPYALTGSGTLHDTGFDNDRGSKQSQASPFRAR